MPELRSPLIIVKAVEAEVWRCGYDEISVGCLACREGLLAWIIKRLVLSSVSIAALVASAWAQESGWLAFERSDFEAASEWAEGALAEDPADQDALHLRILMSFLSGQFEQVFADYGRLDVDYAGRGRALDEVVLNAYLHLGRHAEAVSFARTADVSEIERVWLDRLVDSPFSVDIEGTTIVPFAANNFLGDLMPAIEVELNGIPLLAHLDTGGSFIVMAPGRAQELGIDTDEAGTGVANNQSTGLRRGLADTLSFGSASLTHVPVTTVESLTGPVESLVILGTRILSKFLVTWDNKHDRLILTDRDDEAARARHLGEYASASASIDFYMHGDHYIWAHGSVADRDVLMFFDTGLVTLDPSGEQPAGGIPVSVLEAWNLASSDGFTGAVSVSLASMTRDVSSFVVFTGTDQWRNLPRLEDVGPDVLLSHGYLKHYVWTLDFDDYRLYLEPVSPE